MAITHFGKLVIEIDSSQGNTPWDPVLLMTREMELSPFRILILEEELLMKDDREKPR